MLGVSNIDFGILPNPKYPIESQYFGLKPEFQTQNILTWALPENAPEKLKIPKIHYNIIIKNKI